MEETIKQHLDQQPFVPFRIHLTNGFVHLIRYPDQVVLTPVSLLIGPPEPTQPGLEVSSAMVPIRLVSRVEPVPPA